MKSKRKEREGVKEEKGREIDPVCIHPRCTGTSRRIYPDPSAISSERVGDRNPLLERRCRYPHMYRQMDTQSQTQMLQMIHTPSLS